MKLSTKNIIYLATTEGISYLALFITMPLKYMYKINILRKTGKKVTNTNIAMNQLTFISYIAQFVCYNALKKYPKFIANHFVMFHFL